MDSCRVGGEVTSMTFKARVWTGPTSVAQVAAKMRAAGVWVMVEGTEHVTVEVEATEAGAVGHNLAATMEAEYPGELWGSWVGKVQDVRPCEAGSTGTPRGGR
jgi:hypothetical protein